MNLYLKQLSSAHLKSRFDRAHGPNHRLGLCRRSAICVWYRLKDPVAERIIEMIPRSTCIPRRLKRTRAKARAAPTADPHCDGN
jgi:hypothetical protein